jgi:hypothetical protein
MQAEFETMLLGQQFQRLDRLLAIGTVVINKGDFLAVEAIITALLIGNVFDHRIGLCPIGGGRGENIGEDPAIGGIGPAISHCEDRNPVIRRPFDQGIGNAS